MAPGRYMLVRLSAIGDVVFALEALEAIRDAEPDARIDWLVEDRVARLLRDHDGIERVVAYPRRELSAALPRPWRWPALCARLFRFVRELRAERYDAVLDLHGNLKSGLQVALMRARRKIGFARPRGREASWLFTKERVELPEQRVHRAREGLLLVERLLGSAPEARPPTLPRSESAAQRAEELAPRGEAPRVVLAPGTSAFAAFKRWPAERFAALAQRLVADGFDVVVTSGPGEAELAQSVVGASGAIWVDGAAAGLDVTLEVLRRADVCVAADSGPLHLAQAVGCKVVGLFGPKDPRAYGPRRSGSIVLRYPAACAPCGRRACDMPTCVRGIVVDDVRAAVHDILEEAKAARGPGAQVAP